MTPLRPVLIQCLLRVTFLPYATQFQRVFRLLLLILVPADAPLQESLDLLLHDHLLMLILLASTRGSKRKTSPPPASTTTKRRVCYLSFSIANPIYLLTYSLLLVFSFSLQSKHKEETFATRPIFFLCARGEGMFFSFPSFCTHLPLTCVIIMCHVSLSSSLHTNIYIYMYIYIAICHAFLSLLFSLVSHVLQAELEPISIYHPTTEEIFATMGTPMEGFFDGGRCGG